MAKKQVEMKRVGTQRGKWEENTLNFRNENKITRCPKENRIK